MRNVHEFWPLVYDWVPFLLEVALLLLSHHSYLVWITHNGKPMSQKSCKVIVCCIYVYCIKLELACQDLRNIVFLLSAIHAYIHISSIIRLWWKPNCHAQFNSKCRAPYHCTMWTTISDWLMINTSRSSEGFDTLILKGGAERESPIAFSIAKMYYRTAK